MIPKIFPEGQPFFFENSDRNLRDKACVVSAKLAAK